MIYDPDTLLILKHQLMDINESCRKVTPSDGGLFIQRRTKQKETNKKSVYANFQIPKQKKSKLKEEWVDQLSIGKNSVK